MDVPKGAREVDLRRYTALPGLIDLHTHVTYYWDRAPGTTPLKQGRRRTPEETADAAAENARKTLETGVTTIRDLGAPEAAPTSSCVTASPPARWSARVCSLQAAASRQAAAAAGAGRDRQADRRAREGRIRLDQGLRVARQLRQRRDDADAHLRADEGDRGGGARGRKKVAIHS